MKNAMLMAELRVVDQGNNGSGNDRLFVVPAVVTREIQLCDGMGGVGQGDCVDSVPDTSVAVAALDFSSFWLPDGMFQRLIALCVETSVGSATTANRAQEAIVGATTALVWLNGCAVSLRWVKSEDRIVVGFSVSAAMASDHLTLVLHMVDRIKADVMVGEERLVWTVVRVNGWQ
jgi:hypothetical protein